MKLPELSIRRPVLTIVVSLLATIAGVVGLTQLPVREYPAVDPPTLSVTHEYPGAAAEIIEAQITEPLEAAINGVAGITCCARTSREGASQISVEFALDTDLEAAASDVRDQVARVVRQLPPDVDPPILNKADADSQPIFGLSIRASAARSSSSTRSRTRCASACRPCPASRASISPPRSATRCGSGSTRRSCAPTACRRSTCARP